MNSIADVLAKRVQVDKNARISVEFQSYGLYLARELHDELHTAVYIRFAKTLPRPILQQALSFVSDANARNMGALFMWKVKQLRKETNE